MNGTRPIIRLISLCALCASLALVGCGGGGGGGGFFAPDTDWQGIEGDLNFSTLATPTGNFVTAGWPVPAGATSFSVASFSNASTSILMFSNFTSASRTIVLSAGQASQPSIRGNLRTNDRAFERTRVSDFHASLRELEETHAKLVPEPVHGSRRMTARAALAETYDFKVYSDGGFLPVTGKRYATRPLVGISGNMHFYVDTSVILGNTVKTYLDTIIAGWDEIYTTMHQKFGSELMADESPTGLALSNDIYILISPQLSQIDDQMAGFFYSGDLYPPERLATGITNQVKIFYLNLRMDEQNGLTTNIMRSTLAHEFQHMIFFSTRIRNGVTTDDSWLNETMSAYAESACGYRVDNQKNQSKALQMQEYFGRMNEVPLVQNKGWGSNAQYGQVALFGEWLAEKYNAGNMKTLISSEKTGMAAVEEFTGRSFETIYSQWMLAMALDQAGTIYGFTNIDWNTSYSFEDGLAPVTLSGPFIQADNVITNATLDASSMTLAPMACYFAKFAGGGNGKSLDFVVQPNSGVTVFEFGK